jgi:antirestriction protein ArdC
MSFDLYQEITNQIVAMLERGVSPAIRHGAAG